MDLVHEEVNGLIDQSQDLCNTQRNFASEMGFSGLPDVHGVWKEVAKEARVSTILRRRHQYSMAVSNTTGPGNYGRFAYGSFRLLSVRLRLESIRLRHLSICLHPICQFAYVLNLICTMTIIDSPS